MRAGVSRPSTRVTAAGKRFWEVSDGDVEICTFRAPEEVEELDLKGFEVEAVDGPVGKVTEASYELGSSWLVVDTGPWIIGKKVLLPAGVIERIDPEERKIYVDRTRDEIKAAPGARPVRLPRPGSAPGAGRLLRGLVRNAVARRNPRRRRPSAQRRARAAPEAAPHFGQYRHPGAHVRPAVRAAFTEAGSGDTTLSSSSGSASGSAFTTGVSRSTRGDAGASGAGCGYREAGSACPGPAERPG